MCIPLRSRLAHTARTIEPKRQNNKRYDTNKAKTKATNKKTDGILDNIKNNFRSSFFCCCTASLMLVDAAAAASSAGDAKTLHNFSSGKVHEYNNQPQ